jgi:hypothetical protein
LTNFIGMLAICALPAALLITLGQLTQRLRAGWLLLSTLDATDPRRPVDIQLYNPGSPDTRDCTRVL